MVNLIRWLVRMNPDREIFFTGCVWVPVAVCAWFGYSSKQVDLFHSIPPEYDTCFRGTRCQVWLWCKKKAQTHNSEAYQWVLKDEEAVFSVHRLLRHYVYGQPTIYIPRLTQLFGEKGIHV